MTSEDDNQTKEPEATPTPEPTAIPAKEQKEPAYYIKVNYGANVVTIYQKDSNEEYTKPVKAMVCSCRNINAN